MGPRNHVLDVDSDPRNSVLGVDSDPPRETGIVKYRKYQHVVDILNLIQ